MTGSVTVPKTVMVLAHPESNDPRSRRLAEGLSTHNFRLIVFRSEWEARKDSATSGLVLFDEDVGVHNISPRLPSEYPVPECWKSGSAVRYFIAVGPAFDEKVAIPQICAWFEEKHYLKQISRGGAPWGPLPQRNRKPGMRDDSWPLTGHLA